MSRVRFRQRLNTLSFHALSALVLLIAGVLLFPSCGGDSGGGSGIVFDFNFRNIDLYNEAPAVYVSGNVVGGSRLLFYPKGSMEAGLCDSDNDGFLDTQINDFLSFGNTANALFKEEIAACIQHGTPSTAPRDHYAKSAIWNTTGDYGQPDVMPGFANSAGSPTTNGTQFIQYELPFEIDATSVFDTANAANNYCRDTIEFKDEDGDVVVCSVFLNGRDAFGNTYDPQTTDWPADAVQAPNVIVFVANTKPRTGPPHLPASPTAFTSSTSGGGAAFHWDAGDKELYLKVASVRDNLARTINVDTFHLIRRYNVDVEDNETALIVTDIEPTEVVSNPTSSGGAPLVDHWPGITFGTYETTDFVPADVAFRIRFNKPVIPTSVGQSVAFNCAPFNGNMAPLPNIETLAWPPKTLCTANPIEPLCPNVAVIASWVDATGGASTVSTPIPFRVFPLSQNNMATYVIAPLISLPGSSTVWSGDLPNEPATPPAGTIRMRIAVIVYEYMLNDQTGDPDGKLLNGSAGRDPQNLCCAGFHGERFYNGGNNYYKAFSIQLGRRYVNAPVSPNVLYFAMGLKGVGAVDLDGCGMTTNTPGSGSAMLVTSTDATNGFKVAGNSSLGDGNPYAFPVGLGSNTPIPGVNEGSSGWFRKLDPSKDALVRDSYGRAQLYPDPDDSATKYVNISDVEIGEFLDSIYYNRNSIFNVSSLHLDYVFSSAAGNFMNNTIATPPTPNPPPLAVPVGMRPTAVILDEYEILETGAFTIMAREVFPPDLTWMFPPQRGKRQWVYLEHGNMADPPQYADKPFPPNVPGPGPWQPAAYVQNGPLAETCTFYKAYGNTGVSYGSRQQIGNFLFAADKANSEVKVLNSNSMELITTLTDGIRSPDQIAISPDLRTLYISNSSDGTVIVYDVDPRSSNFLYPRTVIPVGKLPKGIGVQPEYEDVFVCNYGSNTISIINAATNTVRKTLTALLRKPWDIALTPRQQMFGWGTETYYGYISNYGGDNVLVFESGPDGVGGVGYDNILDPVPTTGKGGAVYEDILKPRGICFNPLYLNNVSSTLNLTGGAVVAHSSTKGAAVSKIEFVSQQAPWGPIYLIPNAGSIGGTPGFGARQFNITSQWTEYDGDLSGSREASDVSFIDFNRSYWLNQSFSGAVLTSLGAVGANPIGWMPNNNKHPIRYVGTPPTPVSCLDPDLIFVTYKTTKNIDVIDYVNGSTTTITGLPGPAVALKGYFKM